MAFEKYKPRGLISEFYRIIIKKVQYLKSINWTFI